MVNKIPSYLADKEEWLRQIAFAVNLLIDGKSNALGEVTLSANASSTVVVDSRVGINSVINLMPKTANAASALSTTYISSRGTQTFTITHANNVQTDRAFEYAITG